MKILVDADACPVKKETVKVAKEFGLDVLMFLDNSHVYSDGYSQVFIVDKSADSADIALANKLSKGDIVITQDYGVAALALGKKAQVLNQDGMEYNQENIDQLLFHRFLSGKVRRAGGRTKGPKKRSSEDNLKFESALRELCKNKRS